MRKGQRSSDVVGLSPILIAKLPPVCGARHPETNVPIIIYRGALGYSEANPDFIPETFNAKQRITEKQVRAMLNGSMFGWNTPSADPDLLDFA